MKKDTPSSGGTTNGYVATEILGVTDIPPERYTAGTICNRVLCTTDAGQTISFPDHPLQGTENNKEHPEAFNDFHPHTVNHQGANAVDPSGKVAVISSGFDGGTMGMTLEPPYRRASSICTGRPRETCFIRRDSCSWTGAKTLDYSMGADFGMFVITQCFFRNRNRSPENIDGSQCKNMWPPEGLV